MRFPRAVALASGLTPWLLGWMLYRGRLASDLINWSGLTVNGLTNFVAPLALAHRLLKKGAPSRGSLGGVEVAPAACLVCCGCGDLRGREGKLALGLLLVLVPLSVWATVNLT